MSSDPQLDQLVDLFPAIPRSELMARLSSCGDVDRLVEQILAEQSTTSTISNLELDRHTSIQELQFIFPDVKASAIESALERNNYNFQAAAEELTLPCPRKELAEFCDLSQQIIDPYVEKHKGDAVDALVEIVATYVRQKRAWTSRVQDRRLESVKVPLYVYNKNSTEAVELEEYIAHNKPFQRLNYSFMKKLLAFFQGNVFKVLETAERIINAEKQNATFDPSLGLEPESYSPKPKAADLLRAGPSTIVPKLGFQLPAKKTSIAPKRSVAPAISVLANTKVDLHGFTVKEATDLAEQAVDHWWKEELDQREKEGRFNRYGYKCAFVQPLDVVTGRGIHSQGGPKIRGAVIKMLRSKGFQFEEDVGRVVVLGKK